MTKENKELKQQKEAIQNKLDNESKNYQQLLDEKENASQDLEKKIV